MSESTTALPCPFCGSDQLLDGSWYVEAAMSDKQRIDNALEIAFRWGGFDEAHHKAWAIDQMVRALTGEDYANFLAKYRTGDDGPNTYSWDEGIPP